MPKRDGSFKRMEELSVTERLAEPNCCQKHWYDFLALRLKGMSVLDVGAGTGYGIDTFREVGIVVHGIDPLPLRKDIEGTTVQRIASKSYDAVIAVDVIEHVEDDIDFFANMTRVARKCVFLSTPNWDVSHAVNPYHVREYTPKELTGFLSGYTYTPFTSDGAARIWPVTTLAEASNNFGVMVNVK